MDQPKEETVHVDATTQYEMQDEMHELSIPHKNSVYTEGLKDIRLRQFAEALQKVQSERNIKC